MKKTLMFLSMALLIGFSSCSKDETDYAGNDVDGIVAVDDAETDWSVFEAYLSADELDALKMRFGTATRSAFMPDGVSEVTITPSAQKIKNEGEDRTITFSGDFDYDIEVLLLDYNTSKPIVDPFIITKEVKTGLLKFPPFVATLGIRIIAVEYRQVGTTTLYPFKVFHQYPTQSEFIVGNMPLIIPFEGTEESIEILQIGEYPSLNSEMVEFRAVPYGFDDADYGPGNEEWREAMLHVEEDGDPLVLFNNLKVIEMDIKKNLDPEERVFIIQYRLSTLSGPVSAWKDLATGKQAAGKGNVAEINEFEVSEIKPTGGAVTVSLKGIDLDEEEYPVIAVRARPHDGHRYWAGETIPNTYTLLVKEEVDGATELDFTLNFPPACGVVTKQGTGAEGAYNGFHPNYFTNTNAFAGDNGIGPWIFEYAIDGITTDGDLETEAETAIWVKFPETEIQSMYFFRLRSHELYQGPSTIFGKGGGEWTIYASGNWPDNTLSARLVQRDGDVITEICAEQTFTKRTSNTYFSDVATFEVPKNETKKIAYYYIQVKDGIEGDWMTWELSKPQPQQEWEGDGRCAVYPIDL